MTGMNASFRKTSVISLDYGRRRVGVAGCVGEVPIAFGITTLKIRDLNDLLRQLEPIIEERSATDILLGLPITLGNRPGTLTPDILSLADRLEKRGYRVLLVDEALSSRRAEQNLKERKKRVRKPDIDRHSAALILQQYLDGELNPLKPEDFRERKPNHQTG
jgi:putative Holliday junction resolvase